MGLLTGVRILDITDGWAGPMATQVLVDHDATVMRVDRPGAQRKPHELVRLRGRRSIAVDCAVAEGRALVERLAGTCDVLLLEPGLDGVMRFGAGAAALAAAHPLLVICRITGQGDVGPLADAPVHDHLIAARYGVHNQLGWRDGPTFLTAPVPSLGAALLAVQGIGTSLYVRERTGQGQVVSTSLLAGALVSQPGIVWADGEPPVINLNGRGSLGVMPFYHLYRCADGEWLHFGCLSPQFQQRAAAAIGLEAELAALGFGTPSAPQNHPAMIRLIGDRMQQQRFGEWAARFEAADVPYARSQWTADLMDDPQVAEQELIVSLDDPTVGAMQQMGATTTVEGHEWLPPSPAPLAGQHTDDICRELGLSSAEIAHLRSDGVIA